MVWEDVLRGEKQRRKEKAGDKPSRGETIRSCQAGCCPHNVTHLPPQTGCTEELPTTTDPAFSLSHILLQRQASSSHMPLLFEISCSSASATEKEERKRKKELLSLLCEHYCGGSDSMPSQETAWLCHCHHYGHSKSLQPSEINTSWPGACSLSLDGDSRLIQGDRTCDSSQQSLGVLNGPGH